MTDIEIRPLAGRIVEKDYVETISRETVRQALKKRTETTAKQEQVSAAGGM